MMPVKEGRNVSIERTKAQERECKLSKRAVGRETSTRAPLWVIYTGLRVVDRYVLVMRHNLREAFLDAAFLSHRDNQKPA